MIPYGADVGRVESTSILEKLGLEPKKYFLYVSRMEPENNGLLVREAFERAATDLKLALIGDAPYAVTKHAAVSFAEWLAITYGGQGIKVSALCPQGVDTPMLRQGLDSKHVGAQVVAAGGAVLSPDEVAESVVQGLADERMLILPHPEVAKYYQRRATDTDRWVAGMRNLIASVAAP